MYGKGSYHILTTQTKRYLNIVTIGAFITRGGSIDGHLKHTTGRTPMEMEMEKEQEDIGGGTSYAWQH